MFPKLMSLAGNTIIVKPESKSNSIGQDLEIIRVYTTQY